MKLAVHDKKIEQYILRIVRPHLVFDYVLADEEAMRMMRREKAELMLKEIKETLDGWNGKLYCRGNRPGLPGEKNN
jgi:hypothetical protein